MFRIHRLPCAATLLAVGLFTCVVPPDALAQSRAVGPSIPFDVGPPPAPVLSPAFDALGREWIDSRLEPLAVDVSESDRPDLQEGLDISETLATSSVLGAPSVERVAWATPSAITSARAVEKPVHRPTNALLAMGLNPNDVSLRSAASAYQAKARRVLVNALLRTPLGRKLGRFFYVRDDDALPGERVEGPPAWSKVFPLVSPKLNARTRTVGLSFVWRF
jgi:hypothetical protein